MAQSTRECVHCKEEFDTQSQHKKMAGGKINECPDCVETLGTETKAEHAGVTLDDNAERRI